jgi:hypothetical protein
LGFSKLSSLLNKTNPSTGQSLLYNLFAANQSTPNFIAFALQRETQPGDDVQGTFSIGMSCCPTMLFQLETLFQVNLTQNMPESWGVIAFLRGPSVIHTDGMSWSTQSSLTAALLCQAAGWLELLVTKLLPLWIVERRIGMFRSQAKRVHT